MVKSLQGIVEAFCISEKRGTEKHSITEAKFIKDFDTLNQDSSEQKFNIIGACYPEGHPEASSLIDDIKNLKIKVDAGASQLISQLFFDNNCFYDFLEKTKIAGIRDQFPDAWVLIKE